MLSLSKHAVGIFNGLLALVGENPGWHGFAGGSGLDG